MILHSGLPSSQKQSFSTVNGKKEFYRVLLQGFQNTTTKQLIALTSSFTCFKHIVFKNFPAWKDINF